METSLPKGKPWKPDPRLIVIILILLILISAIGLDYMNWKKGEKSFLFSLFAPKKKAASSEEILSQIIRRNLSLKGISPSSIRESKDKWNVLHLKIDLFLKEYVEIESLLEGELKAHNVSILQKEEQQDKEQTFFLWLVEGKKKEKLIILFSCQKEIFEKKEEAPPEVAREEVAIIVDDMGYSLDVINDLCAIKKPITISILPYSPLAKETAQMAHQNGLEVMLHLPMESLNNKEGENPTKGIIHSEMSREEVRLTLEKCLDQVPYVKGVNNHMGSKITRNEPMMRIILEFLKEKNLYFIDSRTSGKSIAYNLAQEMGVPSGYRRVFLDATSSEDSIKEKMIELFRLAKKKGKAIGICHPFEETLRTLEANFGLVEKDNLEPVFASQIVRR
jgi:hypothetical protein